MSHSTYKAYNKYRGQDYEISISTYHKLLMKTRNDVKPSKKALGLAIKVKGYQRASYWLRVIMQEHYKCQWAVVKVI